MSATRTPPKDIVEQLTMDEGVVNHVYTDSLGFLTIGIGRLVDRRKGGGISDDEARMLLSNDLARIEVGLDARLPWWRRLDAARQGVLKNMAFQMGVDGLMKFKATLRLVLAAQYEAAAGQMLQSRWAMQTPKRAARMSEQMRTGEWQ